MRTRSKLDKIAALNWERDPDSPGGYVAAVDKQELPSLAQKFARAGYEVSDSRDDDGITYLWVRPRDRRRASLD